MRKYDPRLVREDPLDTLRIENWKGGLNTLVSNTAIKPNELSQATDVQLVEDGRIQCPRDGQSYYGSSSGSRVTGIFPYYKADGTKQLLRTSGTKLQKYNTSTGGWDDVSGYTYTTTLNTEYVTAQDNVYICNGTDPLTKYNGTSISSFTSLSTPNAPTVTRTGTTGSYTFSYKITAVSANGETTPSTAGTQTINVSTLDTSSYMTVTWSAVTNAIGYNVYGRKDGQWTFLKYLEGNGSTTYIDKGQDTPSTVFTPPRGNSTAGVTGKYILLYKDTLFIFGEAANPSRLYYSGGGDKLEDFTIGSGGGFIDISRDDGQIGTGIIVFKNTIIVFKQRSIYQFQFTSSGLPSIVQINPSVGCIAPRSIVAVENDVFFADQRGIFTIGNEAGFAFDVLRTNELSARVRSVYQSIDTSYIQNIAATYATTGNTNLVIFAYTPSGQTTNSKAIIYDRERLAWLQWTNIQANCWANWRDANGTLHVLYGDDSSGYVKEILIGSSDFGSSIIGTIQLQAVTMKEPERYKTIKNIHLVFRRPTGTVNASLSIDGQDNTFTGNVGTVSPSVNFGHYVLSKFLLGVSYGTGISASDLNVVRRLRNLNLLGRSFSLTLTNVAGGSFTLLEAMFEARKKSQHYYGTSGSEVVN